MKTQFWFETLTGIKRLRCSATDSGIFW